MSTVDPIDRKILAELQRDSGIAIEDIGERIGLSRNACWRRIKQLEANGTIRSRVAVVDPKAVGLGLQVFISVRVSTHDPDWLSNFARATRDLPQIVGAYRMSGDLDYLIRAHVADIADYDRLYQHLIRRVSMSDVSASFVMEEIKDTTALPL